MAKQLNVNLAFTADTAKARAEINSLQQSLSKISSGVGLTGVGTKMSAGLQEASQAANQLQIHLQKAVNLNTGTLNFTAFNQSVKKSGTSIEDLGNSLLKAGSIGQQSFTQLTAAIAKSEVPLTRMGTTMAKFGQTLKNTINWQISSSMIHGFIGAIQGAYNYAKDLNESLNNIRIVTGQSADQMARFAEQANKAAKQLSTTTTRYTDAALIYYQQGLSDSEVKARTDVTVKMANAAGISAETASEQLTAIWNNFDNGTQSLEHYADVLVKLGAETASSSDEISQGMEKFAAVAETVGLSYEYAAAALATVTATTRQSADTVGTAFKTLFARLEGLQLGETLDDGTNLNKYSKALATVGINIKDTSGAMKNMDTILDEMGSKWKNLGKDQQIALAQTVGGMRQYNQLIALMNNWDFFKENVNRAQSADGALQKQQDIYAESWEAAANRVKAAQQAIFQDLLKDKGFIGILNIFEKLLTGLDNFIDGLGGLKGVLLSIGTIATTVFGKKLASGLDGLGAGLKSMLLGPQIAQAQKQITFDRMVTSYLQGNSDNNYIPNSRAAEAQTEVYEKQLTAQGLYMARAPQMSEAEKRVGQAGLDNISRLGEKKIAAAQAADATQEQYMRTRGQIASSSGVSRKDLTAVEKEMALSEKLKGLYAGGTDKAMRISGAEKGALIKQLQGKGLSAEEIKKAEAAIKNLGNASGNTTKSLDALNNLSGKIDKGIDAKLEASGVKDPKDRKQLKEDYSRNYQAQGKYKQSGKDLETASDNFNKQLSVPIKMSGTEKLVTAASAFMSLGMAAQSAYGIIQAWNNQDLSFGEKLMTTLTSGGMAVMMLIQSMTALTKVTQSLGVATTIANAIMKTNMAKKIANTAATIALAGADKAETKAVRDATLARIGYNVASLATMAAITAIVGVIYLIAQAHVTEAEAAEKAAKAAQGLKEKESEAKQELENIKNTLNTYDTAVEKLNSCVKGTEEWRDALSEVNSLMLDILANQPELAQNMKYERNEDGMLEIKNADEIIENAEKKVDLAQYATIIGNEQSQQANLNLQKSAFLDQYGNFGAYNQDTGEYVRTQNIVDNLSNYTDEQGNLLSIKELNEKLFGSAAEEFDSTVSDDFYNALRALAQATANYATQIETSSDLIAEQELENKYGAAVKKVTATKYSKDKEDIYDQVIDQGKRGIEWFSSKNDKEVQALWSRYINATENTNYQLTGVKGLDNNRIFTYSPGAGQEEKELPLEVMASEIAAAEALKNLGVSANSASQALNDIETGDLKTDSEDWKNFIADLDFGTWTQSEIENVKADFEQYKENGVSSEEYLRYILGDTIVGLMGDTLVDAFDNAVGLDYSNLMSTVSSGYADMGKERTGSVVAFEALQNSSAFKDISIDSQTQAALLFRNLNNANALDVSEGEQLGAMLSGITDPKELENVLSQLESYSPEIWAKLQIENGTNLEGILDGLQAIADSDPVVIRLKLDTLEGLKESLSENMNSSDWKDFFEKAKEAQIPGLTTTEEQANFIGMSYDEQQAFLNTAMDTQYANLETGLAEAEQQMVDSSNEYGAIQNLIGINNKTITDEEAQEQGYNNVEELEQVSLGYLSEENQKLYENEDIEGLKTAAEVVGEKFQQARLDAEMIKADMESAAEAMNEYNLSDEELELASSMAEDKRAEYASMAEDAKNSGDTTDSDKDGAYDSVELEEIYKQLSQNVKTTEEWAQRKMAIQKALEGLKKEYKDIAKSIDKSVEGSAEWTKGMDKLQGYIEDIAGVKLDKTLGRAFTKMAKDTGALEKASKDGGKELKKMAKQAKLAYTSMIKDSNKGQQAANDFAKSLENGEFSAEQLEEKSREAFEGMLDDLGYTAQEIPSIMEQFDQLQNMSEEDFRLKEPEIEDFMAGLAMAMHQAKFSVEEIEAVLNSMQGGFKAKVTTESVEPPEELTQDYKGVHSFINEINTIDYEPGGEATMSIKGNGKITGFKVDVEPDPNGDIVEDSGKGGGGGGGGKAKPPKPLKRINPKVRYEGTKKRIDNLIKKSEQAEAKKETAYGKEKIKYAEKEIELKQRQIKLQTQLMEETREALELQKIDVADRLKKFTNVEIEFDVDGSIANLDKVEEAILNLENKIISLENAGADEFTIAHWEEILDMAREGFDDLLDIIEDNLDAENAFFESINELADLNLELVQIKVDLDISLAEAELEYIDYLLEKLTDEGFEAAEAITVLGDKANNALGQIETYRKGIAEILANRGLSVDDLMNMDADDLIGLGFTQAEIDALLEYRSAIIENMSTLNELRAEMIEKVSAAFGAFSDELSRQIDLFEHYSGLLEHFGEIATLTGSRFAKSELRDLFNSIDNAAMANGQANIRAAKSNLEDLRSMYEAYMTSYAEAKKQAGLGENDTIFEYEETRKEMEDALREAEETFYSAWEDTLSKATDILERWVEDAGARFEEVLTPMYQSLDRLEEAYDRMKEQDENYYDNYEQLYHLSQLTRDISNSIDDTDNIKGKQRLRDLMKEITDIQARGVELSEYDVDVLRKRYELEQARQALEDASDNASIVRLQRDQEGNWGYVYTADEDAVDEAEKEYENKLYELQKANDEYIKELQDRILELTTDCKEQLADIAADTTLSPEEKERLSKEISDFYNSQLEYLTSQMDGALANQNATLGLMLSVYDTTKDQLLDTWEETNLSLLGMYNNTGDMFAGLTGAMNGYIRDLWEGIENFDNNLNNTNIAAGSADAFGTLAEEIGKIGENTESTEEAVKSLGDTFVSEFETIMTEVTRFEEVWGTQIDSAIDKNEEFVSSLLEVISLLALVNTDDKEFTDAYNEYKAAQQKYLESLDGTISPSTIRYGLVETNDPEWEAAKRKFEEFMTQWMAKHSGGIMDSGEAFDTGGYTGEWGPERRLAWLHQKELILNPVDTENLLDAVTMVKTLELNVGAFTDRLSEVIPSMMTMERGAFQQEIYITAEFTEATSAAEIQEAFENLINDATQYAYSR